MTPDEPGPADESRPPLEFDPSMVAQPEGDGRLEFEAGMSMLPRVAILLMAAWTAVFLWELSIGALASTAAIADAGALARKLVMEGEWWRLVTATFLHGSTMHLLGNCVGFYVVAVGVEHAYGTRNGTLIYAASGVTGSIFSVAGSVGPSVGASGVVFGAIGAVIAFHGRYHESIDVRDRRIGVVLLGWCIFGLATGLISPLIDNWAHLGGLTGGAAAALVLRPRLEVGRIG